MLWTHGGFVHSVFSYVNRVCSGVSEAPLLSSLTCAGSARDVMLSHGGGDGL